MTNLSTLRALQSYDPTLTAHAALDGTGGDKLAYFTAFDALAMAAFTTQARQLLDDASFDAMLATLGLSADAIAFVKAANDAAMRTELGLTTAATLAIASASEFRSNTASRLLDPNGVWASGALVALTDAATVAVDFSAGLNFSLTIGGNRTLDAPSNVKVGQSGAIKITQDGTGGRTLAYHANWKFAGGTDPVLSTGAGAVDYLFYFAAGANEIYGSLQKAVS